tara:strand:- start:3144 stop:3449 length:306 start_codon:yes stop_codon:yes gene_type:complete
MVQGINTLQSKCLYRETLYPIELTLYFIDSTTLQGKISMWLDDILCLLVGYTSLYRQSILYLDETTSSFTPLTKFLNDQTYLVDSTDFYFAEIASIFCQMR